MRGVWEREGEAAVNLQDQIAAVRREIAMRKAVYPRRVSAKMMSAAKAEHEIAAMEAVLATVESALRAGLYIAKATGIGYGDDPVGFLVASHAVLQRWAKESRRE